MNYATIVKHSETNFQPVMLFDYMVGPVRFDSFPSKYKARKYINEITNNNRKLVSLKTLYKQHETKIHEAYMKSKEK